MREIKFRAWDESKSRMFTKVTVGNTCDPSSDDYTAHAYYDDGWLHFDENSDDVNLMQYTGLKDNLGKEIYEGDVVNWGVDNFEVVIFEDGSFCTNSSMLCFDTMQVIGNIHENPDLLDNAK